MFVVPAIDVSEGRCVRLVQGDYTQKTVFSDDPIAVARGWQQDGADLVHVVDLDGARDGEPRNFDVIAAIARALDVPIQVGGGIRTVESVARLLGAGVQRVILGTSAVTDPDFVARCAAGWPGRVAVGIDARDGKVATHGWINTSDVDAERLAKQMAALGAGQIIYTDISRDGTLTQPNYAAMATMAAGVPVPVVASGGVASLDHVMKLAETGVAGVIVGRALYTGGLRLTDAVAWERDRSRQPGVT